MNEEEMCLFRETGYPILFISLSWLLHDLVFAAVSNIFELASRMLSFVNLTCCAKDKEHYVGLFLIPSVPHEIFSRS